MNEPANKHLERAREIAGSICEFDPDCQNEMLNTIIQIVIKNREELVEIATKKAEHLLNSLKILKQKTTGTT